MGARLDGDRREGRVKKEKEDTGKRKMKSKRIRSKGAIDNNGVK